VPVAQYSEIMIDEEQRKERDELIGNYQKYMQKGKQRKAKDYKRELEILDKRLQTQMQANIEYDGIGGVYILHYETPTQKAFAVIPIY
jgi:hypothetical protein